MAIKNKSTLVADINAALTTNGNGDITAALHRPLLLDLIDSIPNLLDDPQLTGLRPYDATVSYATDDHVTEATKLFKANKATTGAFKPADWDEQSPGSGFTGLTSGVLPKSKASGDDLEDSLLSESGVIIEVAGGYRMKSGVTTTALDDGDSGARIQFNEFSQDDFTFTTDDGAYLETALYAGRDGLEYYFITNAPLQSVNNVAAQFTLYFNTAGYMADMGAMGVSARQPIYRSGAFNSVAVGGFKSDIRNPNTAYVKHLGYTEDAVIATPAKQLIIDPPAVITEDNIITWPDAGGIAQVQTLPFYEPNRYWELTNHFSEDSDGDTTWKVILIGAGAKVDATEDQLAPNRPGIFKLETGTDAAGVAMLIHGEDETGVELGGGKTLYQCHVYIPILATAAEDFIMRLGFGDEIAGAVHDDGTWLENNRSVSLNWGLRTAKLSTRTTTDSGDLVDVATWVKVGAIVNAAASSIEYFIDDASVGTIVTNIPTARINPSIGIIKTAGVTNRVFLIDFYNARMDFTTPT